MSTHRATGARRTVLVRDAMTRRPVTVRAGAAVEDALALLDRHSLTMLPVLSPAGLIVGVVTERDLLREAVRPYLHSPSIPVQRGPTGSDPRPVEIPIPGAGRPRSVVDVMDHRTVTVRADATLADAGKLMTAAAVAILPVIDEHHRVVGVISRGDILRAH